MGIGDQFRRDGFYLAKGVFSGATLSALECDFDRIVRQISQTDEEINARWSGAEMDKLGAANTVVIHTHNVQHYSAAWTQAFLDPEFLGIAAEILGEDIVLHHSKLFQKPAENGAPFPMHQDWNYFPFEKDSMIAAIIHVSDATDEMGCLRVYPESHKVGRMDDSNGQNGSFMLENYPIEKATPLEAEAGDVLFFSYLTVHGSMPNRSDRTRKTVLVQLHSGADVPEPCSHPYEGLVLQGWNHAMTRNQANRTK